MTKTEAKKIIREHYKSMMAILNEKIVDWNLWKSGSISDLECENEWYFTVTTISENHNVYRYAGYFEDGKLNELESSTGLLKVVRGVLHD